jgi:hypothetical protein
MINEYTDIEDFYAAKKELIRQESEGIDYIKDTFGIDRVYSACPPGNQKSYVAMYGYHDMGIPVYADTFCDVKEGTGAYYCNMFHVYYYFGIEWFLRDATDEDIKAKLDDLATRERAIIYTHPNMIIKNDFWDAVNYHKENLVEFGKWIEPDDLPKEITEAVLNNMRKLIRFIKADPRFRITTYAELAKELKSEGERVVQKSDIEKIYNHLKEKFFPMQKPISLSLSDMMLACRDFILGKEKHICADVYGFLDKPYEIDKKITVSSSDIIKACDQIKDGEFLPAKIKVGEEYIGPADWLIGALEVLNGATCVDILPNQTVKIGK